MSGRLFSVTLNGPVRTLGYRCVACGIQWPVVDECPVPNDQRGRSEPSDSENTGLSYAGPKQQHLDTTESAVDPRPTMAKSVSDQQLSAPHQQSQ